MEHDVLTRLAFTRLAKALFLMLFHRNTSGNRILHKGGVRMVHHSDTSREKC